VNPGPLNNRGEYNPELATVTYRDVVKKGWRRRPERIPVFWRPAVAKALAAHDAWQQKRETELRIGTLSQVERDTRERRALARFPNLAVSSAAPSPAGPISVQT
jgi:hypothetical protein